MGIESTHPQYDSHKDDWIAQRDFYQGERAVKDKRDVYLPPTPSMILDGFGKGEKRPGEQIYKGYIERAVFPDYIKSGVAVLAGMLHHKPATIELPKKMEPLLNACTLKGDSLYDLLRLINVEQLITGRVGLLADLPKAKDPATNTETSINSDVLPYIALYVAESITNWDEATLSEGMHALNLVVLNESSTERTDGFNWVERKKYRVLQLGLLDKEDAQGEAIYVQGTFSDSDGSSLTYSESNMLAPTYKGATLEEIPFVFINTNDLSAVPDNPPLLGLGRLCLTIYRDEAVYRQALFMTGQDTLVVIGGVRNPAGEPGEDDAIRTGAGSKIDVDIGGDAKYIGVNSQGLSEQRSSLENDHKRAATMAGQLLPTGKANSQESGEALKTRLAAQTASLNQIALVGAKGLEVLLKTIAGWIGADPEEVKVTPNMEFGELELTATDIQGLMQARLTGAPLSKKSIHDLMVEKRLTTMTFDEEMQQISEEDAAMPRVAAGASTLTAEEQLAQQQQQQADLKNRNKNKPNG